MNIERVCVYCASSTQIPAIHLETAYNLGKTLANNNITVVYGGGSVGSMGALADAVLASNGQIIGVIPQFMMKLEWGNPFITQMIVVNTMAERKLKFIENIDAVIALPGGTGTLEELCEVISLKKLGLFTKPIIIVNTDGFYAPLLDLFDMMINNAFIRPEHSNIYTVVENHSQVIDAIKNAPVLTDAIKLAAL